MKNIFTGIVITAAALGALAFFGLTPFGKHIVTETFGTSTQGGTGKSALQYNVYGVNLAAPGASATSSSVLNNTGNDLYVESIHANCEGVGTSKTAYTGTGLAALTVTVGTSTVAATSSASNFPIVTAITIATGTVNFILASSTPGMAGNQSYLDIWHSGEYMSFFTNATNTAVCTFGVGVTTS